MSLDSEIAYRLQSGSRQENSYRDRDCFLQTEEWVVTPFEGGRDTLSVAIYFSFKKILSQQERLCHDIIFQ